MSPSFRVFLPVIVFLIGACDVARSRPDVAHTEEAVTAPSISLSCPATFVVGTPQITLTATVKNGTSSSPTWVTWSSSTPSAGAAFGLDDYELQTNLTSNVATVAFSASNLGKATIVAAWGGNTGAPVPMLPIASTTCSINVVNPAVTMSCPSSFVANSEEQNLSITLKNGAPLNDYSVVWTAEPLSVLLDTSLANSSATNTGGVSSVGLTATTTGTAVVTATWGAGTTGESKSCTIPIVNPTGDTISCPSTFLAGSAPANLTLTLKDGSVGVGDYAVEWTSTGVAATLSPSAGSDDSTATNGVSTATFSSIVAGKATVIATWASGSKSCPITVKPNIAATGATLNCPAPINAGTTPNPGTSVTLADVDGNPVSEGVTWSATPSGLKFETVSNSGKSNAAGVAAISVSSTVATTYEIKAVYLSGTTLVPATCSLTVNPGPLSAKNSTLGLAASAVAGANVPVNVLAKDVYGNVDTQASINLSVTGTAAFNGDAVSVSTSGIGTLSTSLSTIIAGPQSLTANITGPLGGPVLLSKTITFSPGPDYFDSDVTSSYVFFDETVLGTTNKEVPLLVTACMVDQYDNRLIDEKVTFSASGSSSNNTFSPNPAVTDADGCATTSWTSTLASVSCSTDSDCPSTMPECSPFNGADGIANGSCGQAVYATAGGGNPATTLAGPQSSVAVFVSGNTPPALPAQTNAGNGTLSFTVVGGNGKSVASITSDETVDVSFTVKNDKGALAPNGTACTFYAQTNQSWYAWDANVNGPWSFGGHTIPSFAGGTSGGLDNLLAEHSTTTTNGVCTATLTPAYPDWTVYVAAEATGVPLTATTTGNVIVTKSLGVTNGAPALIGSGLNYDYLPADGKSSTQVYTVVGDAAGDPLGGVPVTLTSTGNSECTSSGTDAFGSTIYQGNLNGALVFKPKSASTTSVTITSDATAIEYAENHAIFNTEASAPVGDAGCYTITVTAGDAQTSLNVRFVHPPVSASMTVNPDEILVDYYPTVATIAVLDADGNGVPGQQITISWQGLQDENVRYAGTLQNGYEQYALNGIIAWCGDDPNDQYCWPTDFAGTMSFVVGGYQLPPFPASAVAAVYADVHSGIATTSTFGFASPPGTGFGTSLVWRVPESLPPTYKQVTAPITMVDYHGSSLALAANQSPGVTVTEGFATAPADGATGISMIVTVATGAGAPIAGVPVLVTTTGTGDSIALPGSAVTAADGTYAFSVRSTVAQSSDTVIATVGSGFASLPWAMTVAFTPVGDLDAGPLGGSQAGPGPNPSTLTAQPATLLADPSGAIATTLTMTVDWWGNLVSGANVVFTVSGTDTTLCVVGSDPCAIMGTTNANGQLSATLSSAVSQTVTVIATVDGNDSATAQVEFVATGPTFSAPTATVTGLFVSGGLGPWESPCGSTSADSCTFSYLPASNGSATATATLATLQPNTPVTVTPLIASSSSTYCKGGCSPGGVSTTAVLTPTGGSWITDGDGNITFTVYDTSVEDLNLEATVDGATVPASTPISFGCEGLSTSALAAFYGMDWIDTFWPGGAGVGGPSTFDDYSLNGAGLNTSFMKVNWAAVSADIASSCNSPNNTCVTPGVIGGAASFTQASSLIMLPTALSSGAPAPASFNGTGSVCAWVQPSAPPSGDTVVPGLYPIVSGLSDSGMLGLNWSTASDPAYGIAANDLFFQDGATVVDSGAPYLNGGSAPAWTQVCWTFGGGTITTYVNGTQVAQTTGDPSSTLMQWAAGTIAIGAQSFNTADASTGGAQPAFSGLIDEVSLWTQPLSASDVRALYGNGNACRPAQLFNSDYFNP